MFLFLLHAHTRIEYSNFLPKEFWRAQRNGKILLMEKFFLDTFIEFLLWKNIFFVDQFFLFFSQIGFFNSNVTVWNKIETKLMHYKKGSWKWTISRVKIIKKYELINNKSRTVLELKRAKRNY